MSLFSDDFQILVSLWFTKPITYQKRSTISNIIKDYYSQVDKIKEIDDFFSLTYESTKEKEQQFNEEDYNDKCIRNANTCLEHCIKYDERNGFQGLLLYIFFTPPFLIGKFWLIIFCTNDPPTNSTTISNQISAPSLPSPPINKKLPTPIVSASPSSEHRNFSLNSNSPYFSNSPNKPPISNTPANQITINQPNPVLLNPIFESLLKILDIASDVESNENFREFVNYFLTRFLKIGLEEASSKLSPDYLRSLFEHLTKYLYSISFCNCKICLESFECCCKAFKFYIEAVFLKCEDNVMQFEVINSLLSLFNELVKKGESSFTFLTYLLNELIGQINPFYLGRLIKPFLSNCINIGLYLTTELSHPHPELMQILMRTINDFFNEETVYKIEDSELITKCVRFFYLNRFYEPFRGITQKILNSNLFSKIDLKGLEDIVWDALVEEEEDNNDNEETSVDKEYVALFNELRGKGKKKKNENFFDSRLVEDNIKLGITQALQVNMKNIEAITPIEESCKKAFSDFCAINPMRYINNNHAQKINLFFET